MGYAPLFTGGIFGAVRDVAVEAKRVVLERILGGTGMDPLELVIFGDGPVEGKSTTGTIERVLAVYGREPLKP